MSGEDKKEDKILKDLKEVHEKVLADPEKGYNPDADKISTEDQAEQLKGSDADIDPTIGRETDGMQAVKEQTKGSDAEPDKGNP